MKRTAYRTTCFIGIFGGYRICEMKELKLRMGPAMYNGTYMQYDR